LFTIKIPTVKLVRLAMNNNTCSNIEQVEMLLYVASIILPEN